MMVRDFKEDLYVPGSVYHLACVVDLGFWRNARSGCGNSPFADSGNYFANRALRKATYPAADCVSSQVFVREIQTKNLVGIMGVVWVDEKVNFTTNGKAAYHGQALASQH